MSLFSVKAQQTCNTVGNLVVFSNYDGGILTINVDQNIPNLKVGICTYEPVQVSFTGAFVGNITQVIYAGFNSTQNNNNCGLGNFVTSVSGVASSIVQINTNPPVGYIPAHGNGAGNWGGTMIGAAGLCDTMTSAGGVNTPDEIVYYFQAQTNGTLLFHKTQYTCWMNETVNISNAGNCCILPPNQCNLNASIAITQNSACNPCNYNGPTILINEINIYPNSGDGSIFGNGPSGQAGKGEWIELFNPNWCDSVDISGYILGSYNSVGSAPGDFLAQPPYRSDGMGFILPPGTIVPPLGFMVVRGANASPPPTGVIDIVVNNNNNNACISGGLTNSRIWFANAGGWFAFYNAFGVPQNAIKWGSPTAGDLNQSPCIPPNNSLPVGTTTLQTYNQIAALGLSANLGTPSQGMTFRRMPDGGNWSNTTVSETTSYGTCNDPTNCAAFSGAAQCNGTATVNVSTGTAPFTYHWDDPLQQTTQTATNLCDGTYHVTVTDAVACSEVYTVVMTTNPFLLTTTIQQPGCNQSNGSISFTPFNAAYNYSWSPNVSTNNSASNLSQGTYHVTISQGSCSFDTTVVLQNPVAFDPSFVINQTTCGFDNGAIQVNVVPSGNYIYTWTPAITTGNTAQSLAPGQYEISITDNICAFDTIIQIASSLAITAQAQVVNTSCNQANGAIHITASPTANYMFSWIPPISVLDSAVQLNAGNYSINITDGTCAFDTTLTVNPSIAPTDIFANITAANCGASNGEIAISQTTGGTSPYFYSFSGLGFTSQTDFSNLSASNYTVIVQDSNGCTYQEDFSVPQIPGPSVISLDSQNPNCGLSNGTITINNTTGGISPYTYFLANQPVSSDIQGLGAGDYSIVVHDNYGCTLTQSVTLTMDAGHTDVFIPNVFTPNSDDANPVWEVSANCLKNFACQIFNRWGDLIYAFDDINGSWNGKTKGGKDAVDGVYFYKVVIDYFDNTSDTFQGHITLIR